MKTRVRVRQVVQHIEVVGARHGLEYRHCARAPSGADRLVLPKEFFALIGANGGEQTA